jgi:hypothetical protein
MSSPDPSPRPSQVTVAGWTAAIASVLLVLWVFDAMGNLHSVDTRDEITRSLADGSLKGLGVSVGDAITVMRWALFVSGAAAAAAAILGVFVLQRNTGARIALTVAAVPIVLMAPLSRSFLGMVVGAATAMLWTRPARDWFAGRPPAPPVQREQARTRLPPPPIAPPPVAPPWLPPTSAQQPPPMPGWGQAPQQAPQQWPQQAPQQWPQQAPPYGAPYWQQPVAAPPIPRQVRTACILTWVLSAITGLGYLGVLVFVAIDSTALMDALKKTSAWDSNYDEDLILTGIVVISVLFLLWSVAAAVLAVFAWRRAYWAWILLSISAGGAALVSVLAFPFSIVHLVAAGVAAGLLLGRPARAWFAAK